MAILTRPSRNPKSVCWFGGAFVRAKSFVLSRFGQGKGGGIFGCIIRPFNKIFEMVL